MSWIVTHQCRFQSRTHQQYCVNISKQSDVSVEIKQLIGSEHPFVTSEANGDDIFMPVRQQTGYLRVLDNSGGTLIEELSPENNTQKMVTLVNLTTGKTEWIGFLAAEVFTQPWGNDLTELEFPLKSALACLSDVQISTGITGTNRLALLVYNAITSIFGEGDVPFTNIVLINDISNSCEPLLVRANFGKFIRNEIIMNDNTETTIRVGSSYMDAIKDMCSVFGMTLRQQGTSLILGLYDNNENVVINTNVMEWNVLAEIANSNTWPEIQPQGQIITRDLLPIANFRDNQNKLSFVPGGREAIVTLNVSSSNSNSNIYTSLQSEIKDTDIQKKQYPIQNGNWALRLASGIAAPAIYPRWPSDIPYYGRVDYYLKTLSTVSETINLQISDRQNSAVEIFYYKKRDTSQTINGYNITRGHQAWQNNDRSSFIASFNYGLAIYSIATGAVPCRWSKNNEVLHNGILMMHDVWRSGDTGDSSGESCYDIFSSQEEEMNNCYLNVNFSLYSIISSPLSILLGSKADPVYNLKFGSVNTLFSPESSFISTVEFNLACVLRVFNNESEYFWNGSSWQTAWAAFFIHIKDGNIVTNKNSSMNFDESGGYFALVPGFTGKVQFKILNVTYTDSTYKLDFDGQIMHHTTYNGTPSPSVDREVSVHTNVPIYPFVHLLNDITIDLIYPRDITSSPRTSNVYRKTIIESGFSEDKETSLTLGTFNQNFPSPSFLRNSANTAYIQSVEYSAADGTTVSERPEMHLLNRMVEQYKTMRRTMEAKIATGIDLFRQRFSYNGRKFMAIDKKHDWEREEQEVKFIEVN